MVRLLADGDDPAHHRGVHAVDQPDQRPHRPAHAGADRGGDHARLPHSLHADGHGRVLCLALLSRHQPGARHPAGPRPHGAADLWGDVERRADRDPAVLVHGLPGRAGGADRQAVQEPASCRRARAGFACGGDHRHLRDFCDCYGHRRRGGDSDGPARISGDVEGGLQRQGCRGRGNRGGVPRHPDSPVGAADRLRRDRGRIGGAALCRCVFPRFHAGGALPCLCDRTGEVEARTDAAAEGERAYRAAAAARADASTSRRQCVGQPVARHYEAWRRRRIEACCARATHHLPAAGAVHRRGAGPQLPGGDCSGGRGQHCRPGRGGRVDRRAGSDLQRVLDRSNHATGDRGIGAQGTPVRNAERTWGHAGHHGTEG